MEKVSAEKFRQAYTQRLDQDVVQYVNNIRSALCKDYVWLGGRTHVLHGQDKIVSAIEAVLDTECKRALGLAAADIGAAVGTSDYDVVGKYEELHIQELLKLPPHQALMFIGA